MGGWRCGRLLEGRSAYRWAWNRAQFDRKAALLNAPLTLHAAIPRTSLSGLRIARIQRTLGGPRSTCSFNTSEGLRNMLSWALKKIFGTSHERAVRRLQPKVVAINALEPEMQELSDEELRAKTAEFKERIANGADPGRPVDRGVCSVPRGGAPRAEDASLRRPAARRGWCCTRVPSPR